MGAVCCKSDDNARPVVCELTPDNIPDNLSELAMLIGPPRAAVVPPGNCVFSDTWSPAVLEDRRRLVTRQLVTNDMILLTFKLRDGSKPLGLATCACLVCKIDKEGESEPVIRPYTPVSTNATIGTFQLMVKVYEDGRMSQRLNDMPIGATVDFQHTARNVKIQYPFRKAHVTMLVGGTGVTPMIQALQAILGTPGDTTQVSMICGNKTAADILCRDLLDWWSTLSGGRFKVVHVLSRTGELQGKRSSVWEGAKGFINCELIKEHSVAPSEDVLVMICGPPAMYDELCGPRDQQELTGLLLDMGFSAEQVYKL